MRYYIIVSDVITIFQNTHYVIVNTCCGYYHIQSNKFYRCQIMYCINTVNLKFKNLQKPFQRHLTLLFVFYGKYQKNIILNRLSQGMRRYLQNNNRRKQNLILLFNIYIQQPKTNNQDNHIFR
jgi:hypothetical protein